MTALALAIVLAAAPLSKCGQPYQRLAVMDLVSGSGRDLPSVALRPDAGKAERGPRDNLDKASHGPRRAAHHYRSDVVEARHWLRERMPVRGFRCLHRLWTNESHWRVRARGPVTRWGRAMGIPQALPGRKMRRAERRGERWDDWRSDALVQVSWGLHYLRGRYGSACAALRWQTARGWY